MSPDEHSASCVHAFSLSVLPSQLYDKLILGRQLICWSWVMEEQLSVVFEFRTVACTNWGENNTKLCSVKLLKTSCPIPCFARSSHRYQLDFAAFVCVCFYEGRADP